MENCKYCISYYEEQNQNVVGTEFSSESVAMCDKIESAESDIFEEECIRTGKEVVTIDEIDQAFPEAVSICPFFKRRE